jgi:hypothetical protein
MIWQKAAALGCVLTLLLWVFISGRLSLILENSLPVSVLETLPRLKRYANLQP